MGGHEFFFILSRGHDFFFDPIRELSLIKGRGGLQIFSASTHFVERPSRFSVGVVLWPSIPILDFVK